MRDEGGRRSKTLLSPKVRFGWGPERGCQVCMRLGSGGEGTGLVWLLEGEESLHLFLNSEIPWGRGGLDTL